MNIRILHTMDDIISGKLSVSIYVNESEDAEAVISTFLHEHQNLDLVNTYKGNLGQALEDAENGTYQCLIAPGLRSFGNLESTLSIIRQFLDLKTPIPVYFIREAIDTVSPKCSQALFVLSELVRNEKISNNQKKKKPR